jgi:hypothetical protein
MAAPGATPYNSGFGPDEIPMLELNPVRQRIADLSSRLHALRGFL